MRTVPEARRLLNTRLEFDAAGNLKREVSPRAWDANPGLTDYTGKPYVVTYQYDAQNRIERIDLQTSAQYPVQHYVHRKYDALGRQEWVSLPTTQVNRDLVPEKEKTQLTYWDGSSRIRTLQDQDHPRTYFEYSPEGWQTLRAPLQPGAPNQGPLKAGEHYELAEAMRWEHDTAGRVKGYVAGPENNDRRNVFDYEVNGQVKFARYTVGLDDPTQTSIAVWAKYDPSGRPEAIRHKKDTDPCRITTFQFYANTNDLWKRFEDGATTYDVAADWCGETATTAGPERSFTYENGRLKTEVTPDQQLTLGYTDQGLLSQRIVANGTGQEQLRSLWSYFANGQVKNQTTQRGDPASVTFETHDVSYDDLDAPGKYLGHRTRDVFTLRGPHTGAPCYGTACTTTNRYDARGRLVSTDMGYGGQTREYTLDSYGNVAREVAVASSPSGPKTTTTHYSYGGQPVATGDGGFPVAGVQKANQLTSVVKHLPDVPTPSKEQFFYDKRGNVDCITTEVWTQTACPPSPTLGAAATETQLRVDYAYDGLARLDAFRIYTVPTSGPKAGLHVQTDDATYGYDALDRPTEQRESRVSGELGGVDPAAAPQRTTTIDYLGLSTSMVREDVTGESASRGTKTYGVDATGLKTFMNFAPTTGATEAAGRSWFGFDVHGSASLLVSENGSARASYGYDPYGDAPVDTRRWTDTPDHSGNASGVANDGQSYGDVLRGDHLRQDPFNTIRYTGHRKDSGHGGLDFGAREFSPDSKRFYQRDFYSGAGADLGLSMRSTTRNRYALAGGNPVSFVDPDGHDPFDEAWRNQFGVAHNRAPKWFDFSIRLYSIAYQSDWETNSRWSYFYDANGGLRGADPRGNISMFDAHELFKGLYGDRPIGRDWADFPRALEAMAGWYQPTEEEQFVHDVGFLFAGIHSRTDGWWWGLRRSITLISPQLYPNVHLGTEGLPDTFTGAYRVRPDTDANVHHWAWAFALGYGYPFNWGEWLNRTREMWTGRTHPEGLDESDVLIGTAAAHLGAALAGPQLGLAGIRQRICTSMPLTSPHCGNG